MSDRAIREFLCGQFGTWLAHRNGRAQPNRDDRMRAARAANAAMLELKPLEGQLGLDVDEPI